MASKQLEEDPEDGFYVLEGKRYTMSEAEKAHESMIKVLDEVTTEGTEEKNFPSFPR